MEFWRGEAYTAYVNYLENTGGFYYEVKPVTQRRPRKVVTDTVNVLFFFFGRGGVTHQYTRWQSPSSSHRRKSTSSITSDILTNRTPTVRKIGNMQPNTVTVVGEYGV